MTKAIFHANAARLQPADLSAIPHQQKHSGGITGHPIHYLQDLDQWVFMQTFHQWAWALTGYRPGDPIAVIAGGSLLPSRMCRTAKLHLFLENKIFLFGMQIDRELAQRYHRLLNDRKIEYLYSYPSFLYLFAKYLKEKDLHLPSIRGIVTNGEMLYPYHRKMIES